jgi:hypothetical protein
MKHEGWAMKRSRIAVGIGLLSTLPMAHQISPARALPAPSRPPPPLTLAAYPQSVLDNNPIAYWHLAETSGTTAHDSMGKYDGTYREGPDLGLDGLISTWSNDCPVFDGNNDRVTANALASGVNWSQGFTLEVWVRVTQRSHEEHLVSFNRSDGSNTASPGILRDEPTDRFKYRDGEGTSGHVAFSKTIPQVGYRYHVVVTVASGGNGALYVNGALEASFYTPVRPPTKGGLFSIGAEYDLGPKPKSFFHGKVDEVAVYNHPITALRVKAHWLAGT